MIKRRKKRCCDCSGHPWGRPKVTRGPCHGYGLRAAVRERIDGRRVVRAWLLAEDLDDVEE